MKKTAVSLLLAGVFVAPLGAQPAVVLDAFTVAQTGSGSVQGPSLLGGERDVIASGASTFTASGGIGTASLSVGASSTFVILDYDGLDNDLATTFLLGGFDATQGGTTDRFRLYIESVTGSVRATVRMAETFGTVDDYTEQFVDISSAGSHDLFLSSFAPSPNVDITSVERIFLRFNLDAGESISISGFELAGAPVVTPVPEPATAWLLGAGLALVAVARRRSMKAV